ncbi:NrsF family protein [Elioraea sp.]|uniref:NrsF family protein n=1 Tax=Elioraea sp. TaxID=2185103 RepID=UPI003F72F9B8
MRPVRRLRPPMLRAALWLASASAMIALVVAMIGLRVDLAERLSHAWEVAQLAAAVATAVLAAIAAFHLSLPDRSERWALLPLPGFAMWVASLGWGCVSDFLRFGPDGLALGTSWSCLGFILAFSVPTGAAMLFMLRHAGRTRPLATGVAAITSVAMLASVGLSLVHYLDAAVMVLFWHVGSVLAVVAVGGALSSPVMQVASPIEPRWRSTRAA